MVARRTLRVGPKTPAQHLGCQCSLLLQMERASGIEIGDKLPDLSVR